MPSRIPPEPLSPEDARARVERELKGRDRKTWFCEFYVHSSHWEQLKAAKLALSPRCEICNAEDSFPRHINMRDIYDVGVEDLETRCRQCNAAEHGCIINTESSRRSHARRVLDAERHRQRLLSRGPKGSSLGATRYAKPGRASHSRDHDLRDAIDQPNALPHA